MNNSPANRRAPLGMFPGKPTPRLYDRVVEALRTRHYSRRTEEAYPLDSPLPPVSQRHSSARTGRERRQPFPHAPGSRRKGGRVHPESGAGGGAVPLRAGAGTTAWNRNQFDVHVR